MPRIIRFLQERATGRTVLILFVITQVLYAAILFYTIPAVLEAAPVGFYMLLLIGIIAFTRRSMVRE